MAGTCPPFSLVNIYPPAHPIRWVLDGRCEVAVPFVGSKLYDSLKMVGPFEINEGHSIDDTDFGLEELYSNAFSATSKFCDLRLLLSCSEFVSSSVVWE